MLPLKGQQGVRMALRGLQKLCFLLLTLVIDWLITCSTSQAAILRDPISYRLHPNSQGQFEICWLGKNPSVTEPLKEKIQNYLIAQLTERAGIPLQFYPDCLTAPDPMGAVGIGFWDADDNPEGIQNTLKGTTNLAPYPGHPTTYKRGVWANKDLTDVVLTSRFIDVDPSLQKQAVALSDMGRDHLLLSIALHEVLHAFGFDHEQNRPDTQCLLFELDIGSNSTYLTDYDAVSIMNYCYTHVFNFESAPMPLSDSDIAGLTQVYQDYIAPAKTP